MRANSKGGFQVMSLDGNRRVVRIRNTEPKWDERSEKGVNLIKNFLITKLSKRDKKMAGMIVGLLERNSKQDLEYSKVMHLMKYKDQYDDPEWKEGLRLLTDGYQVSQRGFGYLFQEKGEGGKWQTLVLNFSAV